MQTQICPRCKFRLTTAKAICNTCGYTLQSARRPEPNAASTPSASPKPVYQKQNSSSSSNNISSNAASLRKTQANASGGSSFWRAFFGLDPLPTDKGDRDERALGET